MNVLTGVVLPDSGEIYLDGKKWWSIHLPGRSSLA
jgi:hypothetical protein